MNYSLRNLNLQPTKGGVGGGGGGGPLVYLSWLTLADLSMVYSNPEWTISFSEAPAILSVNSGLGTIGIAPPRPPENFASRLFWTLAVTKKKHSHKRNPTTRCCGTMPLLKIHSPSK